MQRHLGAWQEHHHPHPQLLRHLCRLLKILSRSGQNGRAYVIKASQGMGEVGSDLYNTCMRSCVWVFVCMQMRKKLITGACAVETLFTFATIVCQYLWCPSSVNMWKEIIQHNRRPYTLECLSPLSSTCVCVCWWSIRNHNIMLMIIIIHPIVAYILFVNSRHRVSIRFGEKVGIFNSPGSLIGRPALPFWSTIVVSMVGGLVSLFRCSVSNFSDSAACSALLQLMLLLLLQVDKNVSYQLHTLNGREQSSGATLWFIRRSWWWV